MPLYYRKHPRRTAVFCQTLPKWVSKKSFQPSPPHVPRLKPAGTPIKRLRSRAKTSPTQEKQLFPKTLLDQVALGSWWRIRIIKTFPGRHRGAAGPERSLFSLAAFPVVLWSCNTSGHPWTGREVFLKASLLPCDCIQPFSCRCVAHHPYLTRRVVFLAEHVSQQHPYHCRSFFGF